MSNPSNNPLTGHPVLDSQILSGLHLLEADAGTGKTWTVARLVLRAVVERGLGIGNVAVLTFTNAAAAELRDRIAQLLDQWLQETFDQDDPFRAEWRHDVAPDLMRARLRLARLQLDDAPIGTIHGFCQRILSEHALSLGRWDRAEAGPSDDAVLREAVAGWWRKNIVNGSAAVAGLCDQNGLSLVRLRAILQAALRDPQAHIVSAIGQHNAVAGGDLTTLPDRLQQAIEAMRCAWREEEPKFLEWVNSPDFPLNKTVYKPATVTDEAATLTPFLDSYPASLSAGCKMLIRLDPNEVASACKKNVDSAAVLGQFKSFAAADILLQLLRERSNLSTIVASQIFGDIQEQVQRIQRREGLIAFDDLLEQTRVALSDPVFGPKLSAQLRQRFKLTFVDEFQDTDPAQWEIFQKIYRPAQTNLDNGTAAATGLILVGDPKQAIYSFRNADIQTYLAAAQLDITRHRLVQNHRANHQLIDAVGALHNRPEPFATAQIKFVPSQYGSRAKVSENQPPEDGLGALSIVLLDDDSEEAQSDSPNANVLAATVCANEIARLLKSGAAQASDIAVLVPTGARGKIVYRCLSDIGIGAVEIGRDTVFSSDEAADLFRVVAAIATPSRPDLVRGALTTQLVGYDIPGLERVAADPVQWQSLLQALAAARQRWVQAGPQAALRDLLFGALGRASPLAAALRGERRLTNLLHLISLLADEPSISRGAAQGQAWLGRRIRYAREQGDNEQALVRLESDDSLVSILTIHVSKGLQFPFVFLPFAWVAPGSGRNSTPIYRVHDPVTGHRLIIDGSQPAWHKQTSPAANSAKRLAMFAAFQESIRLNYVALTRAERRCYAFWGTSRRTGQYPVAMAWLLEPGLSCPSDPLLATKKIQAAAEPVRERLLMLAREQPAITVTPWRSLNTMSAAMQEGPRYAIKPEIGSDLAVSEFTKTVRASWASRSFTSLTNAMEQSLASDSNRPDHDQQQSHGLIDSEQTDDHSSAALVSLSFPRGANPGSCLHEILENADFTKPLDSAYVGRILRRYAITADENAVAGWMNKVLHSTLPLDCTTPTAGGFELASIALTDTIRELSYTLRVDSLAPADLSRCISEHYEVPQLDESAWDGFLNGFIDLLVRIDGRYWLVDWKSNWLGAARSDYHPDQLNLAMAEHGYTLQMSLYTLAVHRMLRTRLRHYQYSCHFGGIHYLFLRGMQGDATGLGVFSTRLPESLVNEMDALVSSPTRG